MKNERGTLRSLGREVYVKILEHDQSRRAIRTLYQGNGKLRYNGGSVELQ